MLFSPELEFALAEDGRDDTPRFWPCQRPNCEKQGLLVLTYLPESQFFKNVPCTQAWVVRVESSDKWYLNSARIAPDDLPDTLRAQIGTRTSCIVFFDAEPDVPYANAIRAIDLIELSPRRVVLLTPQTKRVLIP